MQDARSLAATVLVVSGAALSILLVVDLTMFSSAYIWPLIFLPLAASQTVNSSVSWYPPKATWITSLSDVINGTGTYGFIFNNSELPQGVQYGTYDWCNMPHVRRQEYPVADFTYELDYVEVIHRHHKRTPYASNLFPEEVPPWSCTDATVSYTSDELGQRAIHPAHTYWEAFVHPSNPFITPPTTNLTCQFPQITHGGLDDSVQHGRDLFSVYHDLLHFLNATPDNSVQFRVTNNPITSHIAGMIITGMYGPFSSTIPLLIQPSSIDSLEPTYTCPAATTLSSTYAVGSTNPAWLAHLTVASSLFKTLDAVSDIDAKNPDWHQSFDHYFDNLSARQCHGLPLPAGISQETANAVYRLGEYEYSLIYRALEPSLSFAVGSYGVWLAELADNIEGRSNGGAVRYRHNVAHDGSVSRLLAFLQVDSMVWPGMGAEVVFEVYKLRNEDKGKRWVRVLWGGQVLVSSSPALGKLDMVDADAFLGYIYALAGKKGSKVVEFCGSS